LSVTLLSITDRQVTWSISILQKYLILKNVN
jgi:hypothetical protein